MAKRPVLAVHGVFTLLGQMMTRGMIISDPVLMALAQKAHPEKVTRTAHEVADEAVEAAPVPHETADEAA